MLNVICVNKDNYCRRGEWYVQKLKEGVKRHLKVPYVFYTIEDAPGEGWWAKLSLFEPGRFQGRCLYFDLDTIIVGSLDQLASYEGDFAGISDFYHPAHLQSAVMAWHAEKYYWLYDTWEKAGRPQFHPRGDQGWIAQMVPDADRLQTLFPSQIVSLKAHCLQGIPRDARVVCFHGIPRPHVLDDIINHPTGGNRRKLHLVHSTQVKERSCPQTTDRKILRVLAFIRMLSRIMQSPKKKVVLFSMKRKWSMLFCQVTG